jgi:hypothetical protein
MTIVLDTLDENIVIPEDIWRNILAYSEVYDLMDVLLSSSLQIIQ